MEEIYKSMGLIGQKPKNGFVVINNSLVLAFESA